jgi:DNA-binding MarR family transcriptional regulator
MTNPDSDSATRASGRPDVGQVLEFMRLLWNIQHGLQRTSKWMETALGITGPQRLVLRIVIERPGLTPGELARIAHLHPSTITGILQRLVKKGLLRRARNPTDSRCIRLHARAAAADFVTAAPGTVESAVTRVLTRTQNHRLRSARAVLSAIADALADDRGRSSVSARKRSTRRRTSPGRRTPARPRKKG